jgi:hypothetical protein
MTSQVEQDSGSATPLVNKLQKTSELNEKIDFSLLEPTIDLKGNVDLY